MGDTWFPIWFGGNINPKLVISADPGRRKGERVREEEVLHCYYFYYCDDSTTTTTPAAGAASSQQQPVASSQEAGSRQLVVSSQDSAHPGASRLALFRAVSDDTLGSFWSLFLGASVLQCHGVFPSGTYVFAAASGKSSQQPAASSQQPRSR